MAKVFVEDYEMTAIADGIRKASGITDKMLPSVMAEVANGLSAGGGDSQLDALIDGSATSISSNVTKLRYYSMAKSENLLTVNLPNVLDIYSNAFDGCSNLRNVNIPNATIIRQNAFSGCIKLTQVKFPLVESVGYYSFGSCRVLEKVDLPSVTGITDSAFSNCSSLKTFILRSENIVKANGSNVFNNCCHILGTVDLTYNPNGLKDGYIYVPRALIEDYKVATNWTTYESQFRALEDYTVDGTTTGALDESKI